MADRWENGLTEALKRLREHTAGPKLPPRFDARDRTQAVLTALRLGIVKLD